MSSRQRWLRCRSKIVGSNPVSAISFFKEKYTRNTLGINVVFTDMDDLSSDAQMVREVLLKVVGAKELRGGGQHEISVHLRDSGS